MRLLDGVPKAHVHRLIRSGQVRLDGRRCAAADRVVPGQRLRIPPVWIPERSKAPPAPPVEFPIVFEDEGLLVIDKPTEVAVHGGSGVSSGVIEQLRAARPQARFLELVHRLDRETSGVLMVARKRTVLVSLQRQMRERQTDKRYRAVVLGHWPTRTRTLDAPLHRYHTADGDRRVVVRADGREAITRVTGLTQGSLLSGTPCSLIECRIETGRTHQIRVHLAHAGFPILGDAKYGDFGLNHALRRLGHDRMFLHASRIEVRHPDPSRPAVFEAPLPAAFESLLVATGLGSPRRSV
jgi:23S rRNA pseudouridine955/2504/2580 synthase